MPTPIRGRTHRVAAARMPTFLSSALPDDVKTGLASAVAALTALRVEDPEALIPPAMLVAVNALLGCETMVSVDLLRVLTAGAPHLRAHTPQNLGAVLRGKRDSLGRPPTAADFPPGHRMHLFGACYWGGIDVWGRGLAARAQKPKGFWRDEANQIATLQAFAASCPATPITTFNLHTAGFHALAVALRGRDLAGLAAKAGLDRQLKRDPESATTFTADAILDSYIAHCRERGVTLSSHALATLKGPASSLRGHARRVFGSVGVMVDAARARAPDLQPPNRPTAKDGTLLDSWSEVVVWNALRVAFPEANLSAHVVLPGEAARSVDVVVDGVHVEVLMLAIATMARPTSRTQAAYARKWAAKAAIYQSFGIDPVLVEPDDVHEPFRLAQRIAEIGRRIGTGPRPPAPPTGKQTRAKGHWTFEALCAAVAELAARVGQFPTHAQLTAHGYGHAAILLRRRGMRQRVAAMLGLTLINEKGVWTRERVVAELLAWVRQHGAYPSVPELIRAGRHGLVSARQRLGHGEPEAVRAEVERRYGLPLSRHRRQDGCYTSLASIADLLRPLAEKLGRIPTRPECGAARLGPAWDAVSRRWGVAALAAHLGLPGASQRWMVEHGSRLL